MGCKLENANTLGKLCFSSALDGGGYDGCGDMELPAVGYVAVAQS